MFLRPSCDVLSDFFYVSLNLVSIPKIRVSINVAPRRGTLSKKTYERGQAKKSGLLKCLLAVSGFRLLLHGGSPP